MTAERDKVVGVEPPIEVRELLRTELSRVGEIDRTERIDVIVEQHGTELLMHRRRVNSPAWDPDGRGEHSVDAQRRALSEYSDRGGIARGAFSQGRLVGIGMVVPHIRPTTAQLAFLHVSHGFRSTGFGGRLCVDLESIAHGAGDSEIVVTATPSENTVRFYLGRGYRPMAQPLADLFAAEPSDIHMIKTI